MADKKEALKQLLASLESQGSVEEKIKTIEEISRTLPYVDNQESVLQGNKLFATIANVLEENFDNFVQSFPNWMVPLLIGTFDFRNNTDIFPIEQIRALTLILRKYILHGCALWDSLWRLGDSVSGVLLDDDEFYNIIKSKLSEHAGIVTVLTVFTVNVEWQLKLLKDPPLILSLLSSHKYHSMFWSLLANIAQHPDAKTLLPREVLIEASNGTETLCTDVCALLCSDDDLKSLKLDGKWMEVTSGLLKSLLTTGKAEIAFSLYVLSDLVLPIANLSVVDANKDLLGKHTVQLLAQVVNGPLPKSEYIQPYLKRGRQEASRALWNLAFLESNRALIAEHGGIEKLKTTMAQTDDPIVKKHIEGILHMCAPPAEPSVPVGDKRHIMISYNWGCQSIVKLIAQALKDHGFDVWLDLEQMEGSTLEAMSLAIEHAELVLICLSQKYKDSPNCRLEGEYCITRKVPFVPLMMQPGYKPDGWLGILLGAKLWYDFTDTNDWDTKIAALVKAIGGKKKEPTKHIQPSTPAVDVPVKSPVADWTTENISEWMKANRIENLSEIFATQRLDGLALAELKRLHTLIPGNFENMCKGMGITSYGDILRLSAAVHKLP